MLGGPLLLKGSFEEEYDLTMACMLFYNDLLQL
jgi:hypothetical protein